VGSAASASCGVRTAESLAETASVVDHAAIASTAADAQDPESSVEDSVQKDGAPASTAGKSALRNRRGINIQMPNRTGKKAEHDGERPRANSFPPEGYTPAVLPNYSSGSVQHMQKGKHLPLPGAFPNWRTIIFLDWDDTLCPTSWIRQLLKFHLSDQRDWDPAGMSMGQGHKPPEWFGQPLPDLPDECDAIDRLQRAVINVINVAQSLGVVCIVTNALEGWVEKTIKKWLPQLVPYIQGHGARPPIKVLYGQQHYRCPAPESVAANLSWVDSTREFTMWKKDAMRFALGITDDLYRVRPEGQRHRAVSSSEGSDAALPSVSWQKGDRGKELINVISIGDSQAEMHGGRLAVLSYCADCSHAGQRRAASAPPGFRLPNRPWIKTLKFCDHPSVDDLVEQLDLLRQCLPQLVAKRSHLDLVSEDLRQVPRDCEPQASTLQSLRIQTV